MRKPAIENMLRRDTKTTVNEETGTLWAAHPWDSKESQDCLKEYLKNTWQTAYPSMAEAEFIRIVRSVHAAQHENYMAKKNNTLTRSQKSYQKRKKGARAPLVTFELPSMPTYEQGALKYAPPAIPEGKVPGYGDNHVLYLKEAVKDAACKAPRTPGSETPGAAVAAAKVEVLLVAGEQGSDTLSVLAKGEIAAGDLQQLDESTAPYTTLEVNVLDYNEMLSDALPEDEQDAKNFAFFAPVHSPKMLGAKPGVDDKLLNICLFMGQVDGDVQDDFKVSWPVAGLLLHDPEDGTPAAEYWKGMTPVKEPSQAVA